MKLEIENLVHQALQTLQENGFIPKIPIFIQIDATKDKQYGHFTTNIALVLAKPAKKRPLETAEQLVSLIRHSNWLAKVEVAGPGFINFFLSAGAFHAVVRRILAEKDRYGLSKMGREKKVLVEFVSSNPTGPLHVGHGRHGAFGDVIANLLDAVGFKTYREYYVNDAGRQMDIITVSIFLRYLTCCGESIPFPANAYQGDYVLDIAQAIYQVHKKHFAISTRDLFSDLPSDEPEGGDKEIYIDALIERTKRLLGDRYTIFYEIGLENILTDIREDLAEFGVHFDNWFSEKKWITQTAVDQLFARLRESGYVYEKDGALWFRGSELGDTKDRVLVRSNGQRTYFANDVAYHLQKFERGFDIAIDLFGSDHHGYIPRMKAAIEACGINPERLVYLLVQFVTLYRQGQQVQMSTRGGNFVTLRELRQEVGNDAARFFYVMRKCDQHMDFDLDLAKSQSNENPVYYVQYAHARICSVLKNLAERGFMYDETSGMNHLDLLNTDHEQILLNDLSHYPDIIVNAALHYEPHQLTNYLRELAGNFHAYYNSHQFLVDENNLRNARLTLILSVRQILLNGFRLLGVSAPQSM